MCDRSWRSPLRAAAAPHRPARSRSLHPALARCFSRRCLPALLAAARSLLAVAVKKAADRPLPARLRSPSGAASTCATGSCSRPRADPLGLVEGTGFKQAILRALGARIGKRVHIHRGVDLRHGGWDLLEIGDDVTLGQDASLRLVDFEDGQMVDRPGHASAPARRSTPAPASRAALRRGAEARSSRRFRHCRRERRFRPASVGRHPAGASRVPGRCPRIDGQARRMSPRPCHGARCCSPRRSSPCSPGAAADACVACVSRASAIDAEALWTLAVRTRRSIRGLADPARPRLAITVPFRSAGQALVVRAARPGARRASISR